MREAPWSVFVQPDQRSCGAASMVVARFLEDTDYRKMIEGTSLTTPRPVAGDAAMRERFQSETLALHRRITRAVDVSGRLQLPWPRQLGTPPWAVARQLSAIPGGGDGTPTAYSWHNARWGPSSGYQRLLDATAQGRVSALFVGSTWLPRHVVLVVDAAGEGTLQVYDPARGRAGPLARTAFTSGRIGVAGWDVGWFVVTPD